MVKDVQLEIEDWLTGLANLLAVFAPAVPDIKDVMRRSNIDTPSPTFLPIVDQLPRTPAYAPVDARKLIEDFLAIAPALAWRQTYQTGEANASFLLNYGWTELVGAKGIICDPSVSAGLLLLGPHTHYPAHSHQALEYYVPLSGAAEWYDEDAGWRIVPPLATIVHRSGINHAMRTTTEPLLAYFHWSGFESGDRARFSPSE